MPASRPLWCFSVRVAPEEEEHVCNELHERTGSWPVVRQRPSSRMVWVECYSASRSRLRRAQRQMRRAGSRLRFVPHEDWAENWKKHFRVQRIGKRIVIKPSWKRHRARPGEVVIELDPGLSFGTGQHPTTRFCLQMIERLCDRCSSLLDVGTGSGILAIAAAKLGFAPVLAVDNDPQAVRVARANLRKNMGGRLRRATLLLASLESLPSSPKRAVVVANLLADLILAQRRKLASLVAPGGFLILAGILTRETAQIRRAFWTLGFETFACERTRNWAGLAFHKFERRRRR